MCVSDITWQKSSRTLQYTLHPWLYSKNDSSKKDREIILQDVQNLSVANRARY